MEWPAQRAARPLRDCLLINYIVECIYASSREEIFRNILNIAKFFNFFKQSRNVCLDLFCSSKKEIFYIWKCGNIYDSKVLICCHFQFCTYILFMIININKYMNNNKIEKLSK